MMGNISALAMSTFLETVRDRIFYLVGVFGFLMLSSTAILSPLTIGAQGKIMVDVGLAGMAIIGLLVVIFVGSGMVRKELDKGTILTILAKPVGRREYLVGKFLGLNLTLLTMLAIMGMIFLFMTFLAPGTFSLHFVKAFYLTFLELTLINAAVVFFSTSVSPILAAVFSLGVFLVGHMSESIRDFGQMQGDGFQQKMADVVYYMIPNLEVFNVRGAVVHGDPVTWQHLSMATVYGLGWTLLLLLLAGSIFSRKELRG
ncbi:MAG: ABC transporter permease [Gemmatimonadales bacterium]|nr:ABC transporter permease [Gemmatimonadales bacterium]